MTAPVLSLRKVNKSFGGLKVIDDVSIAVSPGVRTALIGPNGAGKTTLFNLISGIYPVDSGAIAVDGEDITTVPAMHRVARGISRSFQNIRLLPHLSTLENVMLGQHVRARRFRELIFPLNLIRRNRWVEKARAALEASGLGTYPGQVVANLPYGVQKRIEVVRALMAEPRVLLLDEPAAGLNPKESGELLELLKHISSEGCTLFVVEHDMNFVRDLCDRTVVLNFGKKIYDGPSAEVHRNTGVLEAYLGSDDSGSDDSASPDTGHVA